MSAQETEHASGQAPASTGRRTFLKGSAAIAAAPAVLTSRKSGAQTAGFPASPPVQPWAEELPAQITPIQPVASLDPAPTVSANLAAGECGRGDHQRFAELASNPVHYVLRARENPAWVFNPAYPPQPVWGWSGTPATSTDSGPTKGKGGGGKGGPKKNPPPVASDVTAPGPTFFARYGQPVVVRIINELPQNHVGFGSPEISTHLHNAHTPSESDGFPGDYFSASKAGPTLTMPGAWRDHFWPNVYAGLDEFGGIGDPREALGTCWYHDHTMDFTAPNVLKGLVGFYLLFDDLDSGDERDPNPAALRLPSHPYDYPLVFGDKRFDADGMLFYDQFDPDGVLGDQVCVNGKIQPVLRVARRKYRLRLLNGGPSRFYALSLVDPNFVLRPFTYIANDGNLLPAPVANMTTIDFGPAERADIVVDFSAYPIGTELYFVNRRIQTETRRYDGLTGTGTRVLKIVVDRNPPEADLSRVPATLRAMRPVSAEEIAAAPVRRWDFDRSNGQWTVNGKLFDLFRASASVRRGSAEVWEFVNNDDGWVHPVHMHFEESRLLSKRVQGVDLPVPLHERGRKDVYHLPRGPNTVLRVFVRFRDFTGKYVMHCHNLIHEDHAMMVRFDITS